MSLRRHVSVVAVTVFCFLVAFATGCSGGLDGSSNNSGQGQQGLDHADAGSDIGLASELEGDAGGSEDDAGFEDDGGSEDDEGDCEDVSGELSGDVGDCNGDGDGGGGGDDDGGPEPECDPSEFDCDGGDDPQPAISFIAFCVEDGSLSEGDITTREVTKTKDGGEPMAVRWESSTPIDRVVLKTGAGIENFEISDASSGTATAGEGTESLDSQSPPSPCPDGETGVKFEGENISSE